MVTSSVVLLLVATIFSCIVTGTLLSGMTDSTTVPQYLDAFDAAVTLSGLPSPPLDTARMAPLDRIFYEMLIGLFKKPEVISSFKHRLSKARVTQFRSESLRELAKYSSTRSENLASYHGLTAASQRDALLHYEASFVRLLQEKLRGSAVTGDLKAMRTALIAAQRDWRDGGRTVVLWMGIAGVAFSVLALASALFFMRMKTERGLDRAKDVHDFI